MKTQHPFQIMLRPLLISGGQGIRVRVPPDAPLSGGAVALLKEYFANLLKFTAAADGVT